VYFLGRLLGVLVLVVIQGLRWMNRLLRAVDESVYKVFGLMIVLSGVDDVVDFVAYF
jgi:hypothetical protein